LSSDGGGGLRRAALRAAGVILAAAALVLPGCRETEGPALELCDEAVVVRGTFRRTINTLGQLEAKKPSVIRPKYASGTVVELAEDGGKVTEGQLVLRLDSREWDTRLVRSEQITERYRMNTEAEKHKLAGVRAMHALDVDKAEAELAFARAELAHLVSRPFPHEVKLADLEVEAARLRLESARGAHERERALLAKGLSRESEVARLRLKAKGAEAQWELACLDRDILRQGTPPDLIQEAEQKVARAEVALRQARDILEVKTELQQASVVVAQSHVNRFLTRVRYAKQLKGDCVAKAPVSGTLYRRSVWKAPLMGRLEVGDRIWPGQPLLDIVEEPRMLAVSRVGQMERGLLRVGQDVLVRLEALPEKELTGKVIGIGAVAEDRDLLRGGDTGHESSEVTVFEFKVELSRADPALHPTMTARLDVVWDERPDVLMAPRAAVFREDGQDFVWRRSGGEFSRTPVVVDGVGETTVAIAEGVEEADVLAVPRGGGPMGERRK